MFAIINIIAVVKNPSMEYMLGLNIKFKVVPKTKAPMPTMLRYHWFLFLNNIADSLYFDYLDILTNHWSFCKRFFGALEAFFTVLFSRHQRSFSAPLYFVF